MPKQTTYSDEMQDLMGKIPGWIVRWGISLVFILFFVLVGMSCFIKYPEIITAPIVLTTVNPPADLIAKSSGKIEKFFVSDGEKTGKDSVIAVLYNTADYRTVFELEAFLNEHQERWENYLLEDFIDWHIELGELQTYHIQLIKQCKSYQHYLNVGYIPKKRTLLRRQAEKYGESYRSQQRQLALMKKDVAFEERNLERDSMLTSSRAITQYEYEKTQQTALQKEMSLIGQESALTSIETSMLNLEDQLLELDVQYENDVNNYRLQLSESREQLLAQIRMWREKYVLVSPIDGRVTFTKYWSENQNVMAGDRLATVVPEDSMAVMGKMYIPSVGFAKVKEGQAVNVKLEGFPYMEYGILKGRLVSLSSIPETEGYAAEVAFPNGLMSSYKKRLTLIQQMNGTGEIITRDMRLIERFMSPVKSLVDTNL